MQRHASQSGLRFLRSYGLGAGVLVLVVVMLIVNVYRSSDSNASSTEVTATLQGTHALQEYSGSTSLFSAALADGQVVLVNPPVGTVFHQGAKIILVKYISKHGHESFAFKSYAP
jgi:beta-lactam-binding protein with PASTA domain